MPNATPERRRELYLERKLSGRCVACAAPLEPDADTVHCQECRDRQAKWGRRHRKRVRQRAARYRVNATPKNTYTETAIERQRKTVRRLTEELQAAHAKLGMMIGAGRCG